MVVGGWLGSQPRSQPISTIHQPLSTNRCPARYNFSVTPVLQTAEDQRIVEVATGTSGDPFAVLGRHVVTIDHRPAAIVRTMQPAASAVELITDGRVTPMPRRHSDGLFEARLPLEGRASDFAYRFRAHEDTGVREIT